MSVARPYQPRRQQTVGRQQTVAGMKARQSVKIREIKEALVASGILTLDEQARALGLNRSTAWTVLKGDHKSSGLSATIINCILAATLSLPLVRAKILEYVKEKALGLYGHNKVQRRKFIDQLSANRIERTQFEEIRRLRPEERTAKTAAGR
jgi:DNA-binding CsgD family transcriptional regulator